MREHTALIEQIALYLWRPWKFNALEQDSCWQRQIIDGHGRGLIISKEYNAPKFKISGRFDKRLTDPHQSNFCSIGVSINRQPKAIAADIERRLLPSYLKAFDVARKRFLENQQKAGLLDAIAQSFLKISKGSIISHQSCDTQKNIRFDHGTATLYGHSEEISMDLRRLNIEQAIQIAALLQTDKAKPIPTNFKTKNKKEENPND